MGHSEPITPNAPIGHSVHWIGCIFSFDTNGVHHNPFFFADDHYILFFWLLAIFPLDLTSHIVIMLTLLPS